MAGQDLHRLEVAPFSQKTRSGHVPEDVGGGTLNPCQVQILLYQALDGAGGERCLKLGRKFIEAVFGPQEMVV
jgi:hypothetical protein